MSFDVWLTFVAASTVLLLIPGPTVLLVLSYALSRGRSTAVTTAAGVALGDFLAMSASLAGLGALVLTSATLFHLLKWIGAAYLVWLGIKLLRERPADDLAATRAMRTDHLAIFSHATVVTALNPKSIAFFIAFVPQFLNASAPLLPQFAVLIATFVTLALLNALAYALLASVMRQRMTRPSVRLWLGRIGGGALIGMGLLTATLRRA
ncbi:MAG: LysE family translocator [Rhodobacteraceae bacterium]|nr:LysE family translocator [Paracoccaceae bacterium]